MSCRLPYWWQSPFCFVSNGDFGYWNLKPKMLIVQNSKSALFERVSVVRWYAKCLLLPQQPPSSKVLEDGKKWKSRKAHVLLLLLPSLKTDIHERVSVYECMCDCVSVWTYFCIPNPAWHYYWAAVATASGGDHDCHGHMCKIRACRIHPARSLFYFQQFVWQFLCSAVKAWLIRKRSMCGWLKAKAKWQYGFLERK